MRSWHFSSVAQSCPTLQHHGLQHARPPCPSPTPRIHPNPCLLSWWCHPTISSSVMPFSSCSQSFPASGSFLMSQLFASGGQTIGDSALASASVLQGWFPLGLTGLISDLQFDLLAVQGTLKSFPSPEIPTNIPQSTCILGVRSYMHSLPLWVNLALILDISDWSSVKIRLHPIRNSFILWGSFCLLSLLEVIWLGGQILTRKLHCLVQKNHEIYLHKKHS